MSVPPVPQLQPPDLSAADMPPPRTETGLLRQFILLAGAVLVAGMLGTGLWVSSQIQRVVTSNAGTITALYVDAMISPVTQTLQTAQDLGPEEAARLNRLVTSGALGREISAFKLWSVGRRVIFSTRAGSLGQTGEGNPRLGAALEGRVNASLRKSAGDTTGLPLLEVYSPILSASDGRVIGVAEFYTYSTTLRADLFQSLLQSWAVVGAITTAMFAAFCAIVLRGDRTIRLHRRALAGKVAELSRSLGRNSALTRQLEDANRRIAEVNDLTLQRISADLHDGPAQHLAFAAMRIDGVQGQEPVAEAVNAALRELRLICRGLILPELADLDTVTLLRRAVAAHEARTGRPVALRIAGDLPPLDSACKTCVYRFVQETLNNGAHHAPGAAQSVDVVCDAGGLRVETRDAGPGFHPEAGTEGLGLVGLRERVRGLRGQFTLQSSPRGGTSVTLVLPVDGGPGHEEGQAG